MRKGQEHPSAAVSKNMIAEGLLELMGEQPLADITIVQLCERAQVSRRTFYRHFHTTGDVVSHLSGDIAGKFADAMRACREQPYRNIVTAYFLFWREHAGFLELLNRNNMVYVVFTPYLLCLPEIPWLFRPQSVPGTEAFNCELAYCSGGLWSVLTYWIMNGCRQPEEELAETICRGQPDTRF